MGLEMTDENKTERLHMLISPSELKAIDDWGYKNRIRTKAESVRRLCQIGLAYDRDGTDLQRRTERALRATLVVLDKLKKTGQDVPKGLRGGLVMVLEEQVAANKAVTSALVAGSILQDGSDMREVDQLMAEASEWIGKLVGEGKE